jgi:hypothetical protein
MPDDPLAQFRKRGDTRGEAPPAQTQEPGELPPYIAFEAQDKVPRLDIQRSSGASHCVANAYLLDIIYGRRFYTSFVLVYNFMTVTVKGKNLRDVVQALRLGKCAAIFEYHPELYAPPASDKPIITSIEVVTGERAAAMREADTENKGSSA